MENEKKEKVTIKDIFMSLKQLPQTIKILNKADGKLFKLLVVLSIVTGLLPIVSILVTQELLNILVSPSTENLRNIIYIIVFYIVYNIVSYIVGEIESYIQTLYQYRLQYNLQYMMMEQCSNMDLKKFESSETYDKVEKLTTEVSYRPYQMFMAVISMCTSFVSLISAVGIIFVWNKLAAVAMLIVPVLSLFYYLKIGQKEFDLMWNRANAERKLWYYNYLMTHDFSFKEMKILDLAEYLLEKYKRSSEEFISENRSILDKKTLFNIIFGLLIYIVSGMVIARAALMAYSGMFPIGNVTAIIKAVSMVQTSSSGIMVNLYAVYSCSLYMMMLFKFLDENKKEDDGKLYLNSSISNIEINNVSYSYDDKSNVLNDISLTLDKGKRIAIVGPNGSGKSTLLKLITGLYKPQKGTIKINGMEYDNLNQKSYHEKMSVLFQDFVKYELPVKENVGFGDVKNVDNMQKINEAIHCAGADFLMDDNGSVNLETQLGNWFKDGRELSQGQWQKVALARAWMKKADCYILDEPNAALDTLSEKEVFTNFFQLSQDKLGVYISHRLCAAQMADEIIVMNKGKVEAVGTHNELMEKCMVYKEMYDAENYVDVA